MMFSYCKTYLINDLSYSEVEFDSGSTKDPAIRVVYFPKISIPSKYRSRRWNNFKAHFPSQISYGSLGSFTCGGNTSFKVESCGIHLIYAQNQNNCPQPSRESSGDTKHQTDKKRFFSLQVIKDFLNPY